MNKINDCYSAFWKKLISLSLSSLFVVNQCAFYVKAGKLRSYAQMSFSENYQPLCKFVKILGKTVIGASGLVCVYYTANWVLDKMIPRRAEQKRISCDARIGLEDSRKELMELLSNKDESDDAKEVNNAKIDNVTNKINKYRLCLESEKNETNYIKNVTGIGGLIAVAELGYKSLQKIGETCEATVYIGALYPAYKRFELMADYVKDVFKTSPKLYTKEEIFSNFDRVFCNLQGQEDAKKGIKNFIYDNVLAKDEAKWSKKKYNHGDILYFYGPSGVGKSFAANYLPYAFSPCPKVFTLFSSDIDKERKDQSVVSQIFSVSEAGQQNSKFVPSGKKSALVEFIKGNPGGFVKIEEYDKLCSPALDEVFRTISESGVITVDGETIDCSGITFILTSNEDDVSMNGFDKETAEKLSSEALQEGYTRVWHEKSFLNRVRKVKFSNLTSKEYKEIIVNRLKDKFRYWSNYQNGGFKLMLDNDSVEKLARKVEKINQGARPIDLLIMPELQSVLIQKIKAAPTFGFYKGKEIRVRYDEIRDKFCLD